MNKENNQKKAKPAGNLSLAAGLLKGLNNERAALDQRAQPEEQVQTPPRSRPSAAPEPIAAIAIPVSTATPNGNRFQIPIADCISNPYNPREFYPESKVQELALTLQRDGQIEAIKVTQLPQYPGKYVLIDGERRLRAKRSLGEKFIDAELRSDTTPAELYSIAYRANNDHERQTIFDDAIAWRRVLEERVFVEQNALAERVGRDKAYVSKVLSLNALPRPILERMAEFADRVGLQAAYFIKLIFDKAGEEQATRNLSAVIDGKRTVRQLELAVRDLTTPSSSGKKERARYHQRYDFKTDGQSFGQLKTFPDGRINLELIEIPATQQEALADKLKEIVESFTNAKPSASTSV
ncbi:ParB/RepB/Spo0J family partition protein [Cupriavidus basilensis]|uniref:ParB/RepB/Spo0J family partition protein n=1 Tax=Cupriavidus basilensis TaxID=68895 RepID=UPI0020A69163|nr:ParB/RepB/Spo0J family partition protein [Cupriavidus basilensis]MCP3024983.1 ParB/RepB/Spo0J family partition protein [Cupriavidus basilensis]